MKPATRDDKALDNPAWHGLRGPLSHFAKPGPDERALRFHPDVSFFSAVEELDDERWEALADLVEPEGIAVLFRDEVPAAPDGWTELFRESVWQLVAGQLAAVPDIEPLQLGADDVDDMMELILLTEPGPFAPRTHELGTYVGVRQAGRLVAMAGQRFRVPGFIEVSAVCTHPDVRRQGLGAALTLWLAREIRRGGDEAFLHVVETNENALRLYRAIGFELRRKVSVVGAQWASSGVQDTREPGRAGSGRHVVHG